MQPKRPAKLGQNSYKPPRWSTDGIIRLPPRPLPQVQRQVEEPPAPNYLKAAPIRRPSDYRQPGHKPIVALAPDRLVIRPETTAVVPLPVSSSHKAAPPKRSGLVSKIQLVVLVVICSAVGLMAFNVVLGQIVIGIYGLAAILFRVKSQTTFTLALMALVCVPIILLLRRQDELAENFAVYAFLLLVVGVISAIIELRHESKKEQRTYSG